MSNKWNEMKYVSVKWSVAYFFCNLLFIHPGLPWCGLKLVMTKEKLRTKSSHYLRRQQFYCLFFISLLTLLEKWTLIPRVYSSLSDSRDELRYSLSIYHLTVVFSVFDHGKQQIKITVANFWTPYSLVLNTNEVSEWENDQTYREKGAWEHERKKSLNRRVLLASVQTFLSKLLYNGNIFLLLWFRSLLGNHIPCNNCPTF